MRSLFDFPQQRVLHPTDGPRSFIIPLYERKAVLAEACAQVVAHEAGMKVVDGQQVMLDAPAALPGLAQRCSI
jgi:hypothetical protein